MSRLKELNDKLLLEEAQEKWFTVKFNTMNDSKFRKVKVSAVDRLDAKRKVLKGNKFAQNMILIKESINIPIAIPQDPKVIRMLNAQPLYYHASNIRMNAGEALTSGHYLTYSKQYAQSLGYKYLYAVETPRIFMHTKYIGNRWANYHIVNKSPVKIKQVLNMEKLNKLYERVVHKEANEGIKAQGIIKPAIFQIKSILEAKARKKGVEKFVKISVESINDGYRINCSLSHDYFKSVGKAIDNNLTDLFDSRYSIKPASFFEDQLKKGRSYIEYYYPRISNLKEVRNANQIKAIIDAIKKEMINWINSK